jgi:microfibrillar-associated protein 1
MTDDERLAENKRLGSDLTDNTESTKYVFMQKYYHKGAFYQDTDD